MFVNNKVALDAVVGLENLPETHVTTDSASLFEQMQRDEGDWIAKPPNDGCGANVFRLAGQDSNSKVILDSMTGNAQTQYSMKNPRMLGFVGRYCVMQRYIPEVKRGEKRVVIAGGDPIASYIRTNPSGDHRSNRIHGAEQTLCDLTNSEQHFCNSLGRMLLGLGVTFVAIDLAYPYLIELNIINPGGLIVYERLSGRDLSDVALERILSALNMAPGQTLARISA